MDHGLEESNLELKLLKTEFHKEQKGEVYVAQTTICNQRKGVKLIPDICFILRNSQKNKEVVFFVEVDTGKETIAGRMKRTRPGSLLEKYRTYELLLLDGGWRNTIETEREAFLVLTVTNHQKHIQNIIERCRPLLQYPEFFLFTTHDLVKNKNVLYDAIWQDLEGTQRALV